MIRKTLDYNFHDAIVVSCQQEKEDRFSLTVQLYEVFYPEKEQVKITFSGVYNALSTSKFFNNLKEDNVESNWNGSRINSLDYDSKKTSKDLDVYIFMDIDGVDSIRIHCKKVRVDTL